MAPVSMNPGGAAARPSELLTDTKENGTVTEDTMATAAQAEQAAARATDAARHAERAADQTDARARDVDRWIRWGIALVLGAVLGLALLMLGLFNDLRGEIVTVQAEIASVREELGADITSLRNEIRQLMSSAADETADSGGD